MTSDVISISYQKPEPLPMGVQCKPFAQERYRPLSSHLPFAYNAKAPPKHLSLW